MMWWNGYGGFGMLWMLLVLVGVILLVVWGVRQMGGSVAGPGRSRALEILEERYARGEIDREDFEARRRDLEGR
jgi:putative membrane protein